MYRQVLNAFLWVYDKLFQVSYLKELSDWKRRDQLDEKGLSIEISSKWMQLKDVLIRNPYYSELSDFQPNWNFAFPLLNKKIINERSQEMLSKGVEIKNLVVESSSGSSGIRTKVYMSKTEAFRTIAAQTHLWSWAGYQPGDKLVQLGITTNRSMTKRIKDYLFRVLYLPAFEINNSVIDSNLKRMQRFGGQYFGGYASGLFAYAKRANELGYSLSFDAVISWGDKLFPHYRKEIERAFNCNVFDTYGSTEGFVIAGQCEHMNYHVLTPHVHLELLSDLGKEVEAGEIGKVTVTRLDAFTQPLVRYQLGDLAIRKSLLEVCKCGRPYPMLELIIGRNTDVVQTPKGNKLIVHFFTGIFEHVPEIIQFRVVQNTIHDIVIEVIHELDPLNWNQVSDSVQNTMWEKAGEQFPFTWKQVQEIPNTPSGKPQIIQSAIPL
jgi:phenylacetate-CoA ligase